MAYESYMAYGAGVLARDLSSSALRPDGVVYQAARQDIVCKRSYMAARVANSRQRRLYFIGIQQPYMAIPPPPVPQQKTI